MPLDGIKENLLLFRRPLLGRLFGSARRLDQVDTRRCTFLRSGRTGVIIIPGDRARHLLWRWILLLKVFASRFVQREQNPFLLGIFWHVALIFLSGDTIEDISLHRMEEFCVERAVVRRKGEFERLVGARSSRNDSADA